MKTANFSTTFYLLVLVSLGYVATDIYLPSLPSITTYFNATENETQMTLFTYLLSFSVSPLIFGPLSDHFGRKKVVLGGIIFCLIPTFGSIFSGSIESLMLFRFIQGAGTGAVMIATRASVTDLFTGKALTHQTSLMTMFMPLVLSLAPTIGGALQESFGWRSVFVFLTIYMLISLLWTTLRPESIKTKSNKKISQVFGSYREHFKNRLFIVFMFNYVLPSMGFFAYLAVSPFLFQDVLGLSPFEYGATAMLIGATILVTGYINLKLIHRFPLTTVLRIGAGLAIFSGSLLVIFHFMDILSTWAIIIPTLMFFSCVPLSSANGMSKSLSYVKENFGAAAALLVCFQLMMGAGTIFVLSCISNETSLSLGIPFVSVGVLSWLNLAYGMQLEKRNDLSAEPTFG